MRIQPQQNVNANRTTGVAKAVEPAFKTQSIAPGGLAPEAAKVLGRDRLAIAPPQLVILSGPAQQAANPQPAQAPAGPDWGGVMAWICNPFKLQTAIGAVGQAIGQAVAGAIQGVANWLGGLFKGPEPQAAKPVEVPVKVLPDTAARERLGKVFDVLDEDANGKLEGKELTQNERFYFDVAPGHSLTREKVIDMGFALESATGSPITPEGVQAGSPKARIADLMRQVWGTSALFNDSSYSWWKGQLALVNGDYDRLREKMVDYKKSIERA